MLETDPRYFFDSLSNEDEFESLDVRLRAVKKKEKVKNKINNNNFKQ